MVRALRLLIATLAVVVAAPLARPASLVTSDGEKPNVLLITVDTLRADHLGVYGYARPTSPELDRLAREGVVFTDAVTPVSPKNSRETNMP